VRLQLQWSCNVYVPIAPLLLEVLRARIFSKRPNTANTKKAVNLWIALKLNKTSLGARSVQDAVMTETMLLLREFLDAHSRSVAFPEMVRAHMLA